MKYQNTAILSLLLLLGLLFFVFFIRPMAHPARTGDDGGSAASSFQSTVEKPVNGKLKGVIEIGSTGFNSFVINVDSQKRWEMIAKDFGVSLVYEGLATPEAIRDGINKYISSMFDNAVARKDINIVLSSGAQKTPKAGEIMNTLQTMGYQIVSISPNDEARYGLMATIPPSMRVNSFFVDVGSGNTKLAWQEGDSIRSFEAPGSKYFESGLTDTSAYNQIKKLASQIPATHRNSAFIIGGAPFMLAESVRKGQERYTVLKDPKSYQPKNKRMAAGINIYKAIADATLAKQFVFDWDANFSVGYLLSTP